ncbi:MAG TPA: AAA domain-containing protein [Opitutales bacterium]|nr:AAA domain-containing protein [Opitutales bacterium]
MPFSGPHSSRESVRKLQQELHRFVVDESTARRQSHRRLWSLPIEERKRQGKCISGLRFIRFHDNETAVFHFSRNDSDFREDDHLRLSRGDPAVDGGIRTSIFRETTDQLYLRIPHSHDFQPDQEWVLDIDFIDLERFYLEAIAELGETARGRDRILPLLDGQLASELDLAEFDQSCDASEKAGFNDSQTEAIATAVSTDLCCLIQGPPGTGKTRSLAETVSQRAARGERILVTSFTHRAIHNALNAIERAQPDCPIAKIGRKIFDPDLRVEQFETFSDTPFAQSASSYVIGATPFALRTSRLNNIEFDTVIFDEASQVTLPLAIMGMLSGDSYIFFGDDKQLAPVLQTIDPADAHHFSIFGRLRGKCPESMLTTTYRLNHSLCHWPSESFYNGILSPDEQVAERRLLLRSQPQNHRELLDPNSPSVYLQMPIGRSKTYSRQETHLVVELLEEAYRCGLPLSEIGVVSPFRRQVREIRRLLQARKRIPDELAADCTIDTVERMQGQEREMIICSLAASDPEFIEYRRDFLFQPQRLNVTATRARTKFILLASQTFLSLPSFDPDFAELQENLRFLRECSLQLEWDNSRGAEIPTDSLKRENEIPWLE